MGIDIYCYSTDANPDVEDYLWTIDDICFSHLTACLEIYKKRTGTLIDEYGDTELPPGTISPLFDCVAEIIEKETNRATLTTLKKLREILVLAMTRERGVGFYGD